MSVQTSEKNIESIFGFVPYYIDFYQREYKWNKDHVIALLDDIFNRFERDYDETRDPTESNVINNHQWYYMSSYLTNNYEDKTYIVDGQQRLTTLTLILIKLIHLSTYFQYNQLMKVLETKVYGPGISGNIYWMGQNGRTDILEKLFNNLDSYDSPTSITEVNMENNFNIVSKYLDYKITNAHIFHCFVIYFLKKIYFVNIHILESTDVPMVFEVTNNRGEKLRPYEVLKGELLGKLNKNDVESTYLPTWSNTIEPIENITSDEPDNFFKYYLRAKHADKDYDHKQLEGDYHKVIMSPTWNDKIGLKDNIYNIKFFISNNLNYFGKIYYYLLDKDIYYTSYGEHVYYNYLNELDRQYMLILSSCKLKDQDKERKIRLVSKLLDRHFVLLQLYGCYDSNFFTNIFIELNYLIRERTCDDIENIFYDKLLDDINESKGVNLNNIFEYSLFKDAGSNLGIRFKRYFFARIENFIAQSINSQQQFTKEQYWDLVRNTGPKHGYHVEHILGDNSSNRNLFQDDEVFQRERNRLGALLLLKGRDNISSSNESFQNKLQTYNNSQISNIWNRSLCSSFYHSNKDFQSFINSYNLPFKSYHVFDSTAVEERHQLLFELVKIIWS